MYKLLILSDSHGLEEEINEIANRHDVNIYIHCGDSELPYGSNHLNKFVVVRGNCDWDTRFPTEELVEIGGMRVFVTHGHLYNIKASLLNLQYRAAEEKSDIVCFGHSHMTHAEIIDNKLFINPGSIIAPRMTSHPTYTIVKWNKEKEISVSFHHINGEVINHLAFIKKVTL